MAGYSMDLGERIVKAYVEEKQNKSEVARRFGVSRWTVDRYLKRAEAGNLAATPHPGARPWLDQAQCQLLRKQVKDHNDWTLVQHAEALAEATGVSLKKSAIDKYFRRLGITRKKRPSTPAPETKRRETIGKNS